MQQISAIENIHHCYYYMYTSILAYTFLAFFFTISLALLTVLLIVTAIWFIIIARTFWKGYVIHMSNYIETAFMQQRTDFMKTLPDRRKRFSIPDGVDMYLEYRICERSERSTPIGCISTFWIAGQRASDHFQCAWRRPDHGMQRVQPLLLCQIMQTWLCRV